MCMRVQTMSQIPLTSAGPFTKSLLENIAGRYDQAIYIHVYVS